MYRRKLTKPKFHKNEVWLLSLFKLPYEFKSDYLDENDKKLFISAKSLLTGLRDVLK